jgi:adenylyl cyclase-associated protein
VGVQRTFAAERKFLIVTTKAKKPDISSPVYMQCLTEMQEAIGHVNELRESNRSSPFFPHLSMVSEGIPMVAWVTVDRKPQDSVTEMLNSAQFYGNRVIKEYKEK